MRTYPPGRTPLRPTWPANASGIDKESGDPPEDKTRVSRRKPWAPKKLFPSSVSQPPCHSLRVALSVSLVAASVLRPL